MVKLTRDSYVKIGLIALLCLVICGSLGSCATGAWPGSCSAPEPPEAPAPPSPPGSTTADGSTSQWFDPAEARNLSINWAAGRVTLRTAPDQETDGKIQVRETVSGSAKNSHPMKVSAENGTLSIDYGDRQIHWGCAAISSKSLEVIFPESAGAELGKVELNGASGKYDLSGFACKGLSINLASGNLSSSDIGAAALAVDVASGQVHLSGNFQEAVGVSAASGNVDITSTAGELPSTIDVDIMSGNVTLAMPDTPAGFTARVDRTSGSFNCNYPVTKTQDGLVYGEGKAKVDISLASGNVTLAPVSSRQSA